MPKRISVPRAFVKYFVGGDYDVFVEAGVASEDEAMLLKQYVSEILQSHDLNYYGLAIPKPKYFELFSSEGYDHVIISTDSNSHKSLWILNDQEIVEVTRSELDSLF